jgi:hypothetical protein
VNEPDDPQRPVRGWVSLYLVAFLLMLGAAVFFGMSSRGFLQDPWLLWASVGLSAAAIAMAIISLVLPRRR